MSFVSALILGLVQGLTEFLPVSSSGHLVLAEEILDYDTPGLLLETVVHVATTFAVVIFFATGSSRSSKACPKTRQSGAWY